MKPSGINFELVGWLVAGLALYLGVSSLTDTYPQWERVTGQVESAEKDLSNAKAKLSKYVAVAKMRKSKELNRPLVQETISILLDLKRQAATKGIELETSVAGGGNNIDFTDVIESAPGTKEYYRIPIRIRIKKWDTSKGLMAFIKYHIENRQVLLTELNFIRGLIDFKGYVYGTYGEGK